MSRQADPAPPYGVALPEAPGIVRVVAPNPGPMTQHGTNSWILAGPDGATVIDPGPDDAGHVAALLSAAGPVARIVLTHRHADHAGAASALRAASGAPVIAHHAFASALVRPDRTVGDGDALPGLVVLHTPGHASDHLCLAAPDGVLFSGDHVMGWSTTAISPPDGDMADFLRSLERLRARGDRLLLPGHGAAIRDPAPLLSTLLRHRLMREAGLVAALRRAPATIEALVASEYQGLAPGLARAAGATLLAHLAKLRHDGVAAEDGGVWRLSDKKG
ncbi:MAG: MBL fold metallo-hydrolase [Janthinobacterium lividum]